MGNDKSPANRNFRAKQNALKVSNSRQSPDRVTLPMIESKHSKSIVNGTQVVI